MAIERYFSSTAVATTLNAGIDNSVTSIVVVSATGFPPSFPYTLALDFGGTAEELVDVTAAAGTTLTVTRAVDGTSAASHSAGAAVRHVASARDFTSYQNHRNATTGVHGIAGALVGTSDVQTLSNKTLTSPTINSATTTGTIATGTTVFSGTPTFSGAVTLSGGGTLGGTFTGNHTYSGIVTMSGGGALSGTFSGTPIFSGALTFSGGPTFNTSPPLFQRALATNLGLRTNVSGDAVNRFEVMADGKHQWGDGAAALDTNLYRSAADTLKTDDSFVVGGALTATNVDTGALTSYVPTWTSDGGATSVGNGTLEGFYYKQGRLVHAWIRLLWGTTTSSSGTQWRFGLPVPVGTTVGSPDTTFFGNAWAFDSSAVTRYIAYGYVDQGTQTTSVFARDGVAGNWDQGDPFTWANGDRLNVRMTYEAAS